MHEFSIALLLQNHARLAIALVGFSVFGLNFAQAAPPFIDENGYYWSETKKENENPVIWDRADLVFYTDGVWRWTLTDADQTLMKPVTGDFYNPGNNKRLNELAQAIAKARAKNQETENELAAQVMARFQPADETAANKVNSLLARFRRGERGEAMVQELSSFIKSDEAKELVAQRDKKRAAAFAELEDTNQAMRMDYSLRNIRSVASVVVSERSMFVPLSSSSKPLETDDSAAGFSESLGIAYRLIPRQDGSFLAVLSTKPQPGSPGDSLELLPGDAVSEINDRPITSDADLNRLTFPQTVITIMKSLDGQPRRVTISTYRR
ncbi:MAG: hypothetical protein ACKO5E_04085 [bacterium]